MLIFDDHSEAIILESIYAPTLTDHFWVLDLSMLDYTLTPLLVLEEIVCPSVTLRINGFDFTLPTNWNILIYAEDTQQVDVVEVGNLAGREFTALVGGPNINSHIPGRITIIDYTPEHQHIAPSLNKHQMLCHPIGPSEWINVSPSDTYNKYLKDLYVGDILT
jgi:hypothetical protein